MKHCLLSVMSLVLFLPASLIMANAGTKADQGMKDFTEVAPAEWGVTPVEAKKDAKTGFVVGGKNATKLIRSLTEINGVAVEKLQKDMRPGQLSTAGFLGSDEGLLDVLAADNDYVVRDLGQTHQELARHLRLAAAIGMKHARKEGFTFRYHGRMFRIKLTCYRGYQESPFRDGTKANCDATLENLDNGKQLVYSLLVPEMIERYGFYEGKGTKYRVDPRQIVEVLDFVKKRSPAK